MTDGICDTEEAGTDLLLAASSWLWLSLPPTDLVGASMARGPRPEANIFAFALLMAGLEADVLLDSAGVG